jgi:uncharacterized glyoxalase superfamily protein PhnB
VTCTSAGTTWCSTCRSTVALARWASWSLSVPDVDAWCHDFRAKGMHIPDPPADQPWGVRDMRVTDPDGNRLNISTRFPRDTPAG